MESETAPNPALDTARAEFTDIATNPQNPRHAGYQRGDKAVSDYLDGLYKKSVPPDAPITLDQGLSITTGGPEHPPRSDPDQGTTMTLEDRQAHSEIDTMLRRTLGDSYDVEMRDMRHGGGYLFGTQETQALFEKLSPLITELGPHAEMLGIRFLADLGRLAKQRRTL